MNPYENTTNNMNTNNCPKPVYKRRKINQLLNCYSFSVNTGESLKNINKKLV